MGYVILEGGRIMDAGLIKSLKKMLKDKATDSIIIDSTKGQNC